MRWIDDFAENPASAAKLGLNPTSPAACTHSYLRVRLAGRRQWPWLVPPVAYGMLAGRLRGRTDNIATARVRSDDGDWLSVTASIGVAAVDDVRGEFDHVLAAAHAAKSST